MNITCERDAGDWKEGREKNWKNVFAEPGKNLRQSSGKSFAKSSGMVKQTWYWLFTECGQTEKQDHKNLWNKYDDYEVGYTVFLCVNV